MPLPLRRACLFMLLLAGVGQAGCDFAGSTGPGTATALKDGQPWTGYVRAEWVSDALLLQVYKADRDCYRGGIGMLIPDRLFAGVGTYELGPDSGIATRYAIAECDVTVGPTYTAVAGSRLEIVRYDERFERVEGRFSLTLVSDEDAADTLRFTEGQFLAPLLWYHD